MREAQAQQTQEQILEALVRTMARGVAEVSIPAVAREAGVSIPTVYRHFGSKRELVAALGPYVAAKARLMPDKPLNSLEDVLAMVRDVFRRNEGMDAPLRAALASELGQQLRRDLMPERRAAWRRAIEGSAPGLTEQDLERLTNLSVILASSATQRAFKDYLGLGAVQAADHVSWALRQLVDGAQLKGREDHGAPGE